MTRRSRSGHDAQERGFDSEQFNSGEISPIPVPTHCTCLYNGFITHPMPFVVRVASLLCPNCGARFDHAESRSSVERERGVLTHVECWNGLADSRIDLPAVGAFPHRLSS